MLMKRFLTVLVVFLSLCSAARAQYLGVVIPNASSTGTTLNSLAKLTGAPSTAVIAATTDTSGIVGVVAANAGTTGNAIITRSGEATCNFDGATTAGDYVQISTTTGGDCHDTGSATFPTSGGQVIGRVLSTNGSAGAYPITIANEIQAVSTGSGCATTGCTFTGTVIFNSAIAAVATQSGTSCTLSGTGSSGCSGNATGDCNIAIRFTASTAVTVTVPDNLPAGCSVPMKQVGAGKVSLVAGSGATFNTQPHGYSGTYGVNAWIDMFVDTNVGGSAATFDLIGDGA
jgi:hypothetical protein